MSKPISVQLYSVREAAGKDFFGTLAKIAEAGYAGVEYAGLHGKPAAEVAKVVQDLGMHSSSAHVGMPTKENIQQLAADAQALGYTRIVTGFGPKEMATESDVKASAEKFARGCEIAKAAGLSLGMHNHWWEFDHAFNGRTPYEIILSSAPALFSELDMYWCAHAGRDVAAVVKQWSGRIPLLHVKDGNLAPDKIHTAVGEGKVALKPAIQAADERTLEWLVVELDACATDMMEAVAKSCRWLVNSGLGHGKK